METLLLMIGIVVVGTLVLFRSTPRTHIVYVPVEVADARGGMGCLPLIIVGILSLLVLLAWG